MSDEIDVESSCEALQRNVMIPGINKPSNAIYDMIGRNERCVRLVIVLIQKYYKLFQ